VPVVVLFGQRGQQDHRQLHRGRLAAQLLQQLVAVHTRHHHVADQQRVAAGAQVFQRFHAVAGGVGGSNIGGGKGQIVGAVVGAVVGGMVAGHAIEEAATKKNGLEITVKYDNGSLGAITQEADEQFNVGDRVRVLSGGGVTRVSH